MLSAASVTAYFRPLDPCAALRFTRTVSWGDPGHWSDLIGQPKIPKKVISEEVVGLSTMSLHLTSATPAEKKVWTPLLDIFRQALEVHVVISEVQTLFKCFDTTEFFSIDECRLSIPNGKATAAYNSFDLIPQV